MEEEPKDDFFQHIKQVLQDHEEPYREGAWEGFSHKVNAVPAKKAVSMWTWIAAAAAVIAGIVFFAAYFYSDRPIPATPAKIVQTPHKDSKANNITAHKDTSYITQPANEIAAQSKIYKNRENVATLSNYNPSPAIENILQSPRIIPSLQTAQVPATPLVNQEKKTNNPSQKFWENRIVTDNAVAKQQPITNNNAAPLIQTQANNNDNRKAPKRWQSSIYISPIFGETGINMGYGYSLGYAINDKIKVSTGIAHSKISSNKDYDTRPGATVGLLSTAYNNSLSKETNVTNTSTFSQLESVKGFITGIDIPIDINYTISKKLYATAGVSGLAVLNDRRTEMYVTETNTRVSVETNQGILKENKDLSIKDYATAPANGEKTSFLGFYNISTGFKQKVSPKNAVSIEPFLKVPMRNVSAQKLNYTGTGVRLKFDF